MKTALVMRTELIVGLLGLLCRLAAAQDIQPDEITTTEWFTTDLPTTAALPALDVTTIRPIDVGDSTARPQQLDSRARILLNTDFEDDPTQLAASQTSVPSVGSTLDNTLRSTTNNNDWTPIVWPSTRLVSTPPPPATPLVSPVSVRPPPPGPSTLLIRPTPLLRPLPTILAQPARVASPSTQRTVFTSSARPQSTETPPPQISSSPVSQPALVHFDLEDASSGPKFTIVASPIAEDAIAAANRVPVDLVNQTAQLNDKPISADNDTVVATTDSALVPDTTDSSTAIETNTTTVQQRGGPADEPVIVPVPEFTNSTNEPFWLLQPSSNGTLTVNDNSTLSVNSSTSQEDNLFPSENNNNATALANATFVTKLTMNDTVLATEGGQLQEEVLTTPLEDSPMTTDLSTISAGANESSAAVDGSPSVAFDEANVTVSSTETSVPSTSQNAAIVSVSSSSTSDPITTTVTSGGEFEPTIAGHNGNREEFGRSTTLSALAGLATLFPALTRPPSTTVLPTEIHKPSTTTTRPTTTTTTTTIPATEPIIFPSSVWTVSPHHPPSSAPSGPHFVNPLGGWPPTTTPHKPSVHSQNPFVTHFFPSSTEYLPAEWPSTEGSQGDDDDSTTMIVAVSVSVAVFLCIAIVLLLLLVLRRRRARAVQGTCQPARMDAYSLDNVSQSNTWQRGKVRNSLRASKRSYLNQAFDDSTVFSVPLTAAQLALYMEKPITSIEAEFRNIATSTVRIDELPVGVETKNRYANVLPVPETRVHIRVQDNQPTDTVEQYINANFVKGPKEEPNYYIACQGPMDDTVEDFWQMIWENQCRIIIQLTDLSENGVTRCAEYLPPSEVLDCHRLYGDYQVTLKSRELRDNYVTSHIQLKRMEDNLVREITHLWYSSWPSTGVPEDGKTVVALLLEARKGQSKEHKAPIVVHCSPGTGRTGAVLAVDVCMRHLDSSRSIDIPRCVHRLRQDRAGCVQTGEQYAFIYKAANHYASQLSNAALDSL